MNSQYKSNRRRLLRGAAWAALLSSVPAARNAQPRGARMKIVKAEPTLTGGNVFVRTDTDAGIAGWGAGDQKDWQKVTVDLSAFRGQEVEIRVFQRTLVPDQVAGNAYWRNVRVQ